MAFEAREAGGLPYQIHAPEGAGPFTAILFLHGKGESRTDNLAQLRIGLPPHVRPGSEWNRFVVVAPQKPDENELWPAYRDGLDAMLCATEAELGDRLGGRRILTGLSQGGHGALNLARALRWNFSAVAAVCGWADPSHEPDPAYYTAERWRAPAGEWANADVVRERLGGLPLWLFHGDGDEAVPVSRSQEIAAILPDARLTIYEGVGHDSWDPAYDEPELPGWLASQ